MVTVGILQPGYLPWLGFFDQLIQCDVFVYYDDVQYDKHGWRNRNRIKGLDGQPQWLTVPVRHSGLGSPLIKDIELDNRTPWAKKHVGTIRQYYAKAPYIKQYLPPLEELLYRGWDGLADMDIAVAGMIKEWLGIKSEIHRSSALGINGGQSERLLKICQRFGAGVYLSGSAAQDYLDVELFRSAGVEVRWQDYRHPVYRQLHGDFVSHLSVVDLLLNAGPESRDIILNKINSGVTP